MSRLPRQTGKWMMEVIGFISYQLHCPPYKSAAADELILTRQFIGGDET